MDGLYFVDTNVFLEWVLGRAHAKECEQLMRAVQEKKLNAVCSLFSVYSACILLTSKGKEEVAGKFMDYVSGLENLVVIPTTPLENAKIIGQMKEHKLDFDDALQLYIYKKHGCEAIITLDKDFGKTDAKTATPGQIAEKLLEEEMEQE